MDRKLHRVAALTVLIALIAVCWVAVLGPLIEVWRSGGEETASMLRRLSALRQQAAGKRALEAHLRDLQSQLKNVPGLVSGATGPLAAAQLQNDVRQIIVSNGGDVRSAQVLGSKLQGNFETETIRLDASLPVGSLQQTLYQVESHVPYLVTDAIEIHVPETIQSNSLTPPVLLIRWDIHGVRWVGAK